MAGKSSTRGAPGALPVEQPAEVERIDLEDPALGDEAVLAAIAETDLEWWIYRLGTPGISQASVDGAVLRGYVMKQSPLDVEAIRRSCGGGRYRALGKDGNGSIRDRVVFMVAGPPVLASANPAPATAPPVTVADPLAEIRAELHALKQSVTMPPARDDFATIERVLKILERRGAAADVRTDSGLTEMVWRVFEKGIEFQRRAAGGDPATELVREIAPQVIGFLERRFAAPAGTTPAAAAGAVAGQRDAADLLAPFLERAYRNGRDPANVADAAEEILTDDELAWMEQADDARVAAVLDAIVARSAVLSEPQPRSFVGAVLQALRKPGTEGDASLNHPAP